MASSRQQMVQAASMPITRPAMAPADKPPPDGEVDEATTPTAAPDEEEEDEESEAEEEAEGGGGVSGTELLDGALLDEDMLVMTAGNEVAETDDAGAAVPAESADEEEADRPLSPAAEDELSGAAVEADVGIPTMPPLLLPAVLGEPAALLEDGASTALVLLAPELTDALVSAAELETVLVLVTLAALLLPMLEETAVCTVDGLPTVLLTDELRPPLGLLEPALLLEGLAGATDEAEDAMAADDVAAKTAEEEEGATVLVGNGALVCAGEVTAATADDEGEEDNGTATLLLPARVTAVDDASGAVADEAEEGEAAEVGTTADVEDGLAAEDDAGEGSDEGVMGGSTVEDAGVDESEDDDEEDDETGGTTGGAEEEDGTAGDDVSKDGEAVEEDAEEVTGGTTTADDEEGRALVAEAGEDVAAGGRGTGEEEEKRTDEDEELDEDEEEDEEERDDDEGDELDEEEEDEEEEEEDEEDDEDEELDDEEDEEEG